MIPCGVVLPLPLQGRRQQLAGFAVAGVFIQTMGANQRGFGAALRQRPVGTVERQRAQRHVIAIVVSIQRQRPAIVIFRIAAGMVVLLQMLPDKIEFIAVADLFRHGGRGGRIRQRRLLRDMLLVVEQRAARGLFHPQR